ncbi:TonB-dependent receptor domain-containing protein [Paraferrimonas sedimenticola]|uniref:Vitamin B12 transporter BtuB n=1 Tax=Paraferrimonas sedimenticola TaxID=375674 RepID=A0AA37RYE0_9GAMM|nr:TonB-dependent receptor [Paraferrimonas sedimenticola]GLP97608.1 vitamin B12 transporter BtuB [Paraferrimonas sedimenticola]
MCFKMRYPLLVLALTSTATVAQTGSNALAQTAKGEVDEILVVTGDRFGSAPEQQLQITNLIEREEIERLNPESVVDILETLPAVSVIRNGNAANAATVSIRGANSNHTLVLVDGMRVSSATLGLANFGALMPEQIERVEVVKGPRAALWGSDAIGGVIQIFTRKLNQGEGYAVLEGGSSNYGRGSAGVGFSHGQGHTGVSVSLDRSDGFDVRQDDETDKDGYKRASVGASGEQTLNDAFSLNWVGQYNRGSFEFDNAAPYANETDYDTYFWNLGGQYQGDIWQSRLNLGQARDKNQNFRRELQTRKQLFQTDRDQLSWVNQIQASDTVTLIGGADYQRESVKGDYAVNQRDTLGVYGLARGQRDALMLEGVVRHDQVEKIDNETTYNLSASYQLSDAWRVVATHGTGFKAPSFNDLYYPFSGNPNLKSERSKSTDLSLHWQSGDWTAYVSGYNNQVDDLIQWAPTGEKDANGWDIWAPDNIAKATLKGVESRLSWQYGNLSQQLGYHYLDAKDGNGQLLTGRSRHEVDYRIGYRWADFDAQADYHYQGKRWGGAYRGFLPSYHLLGLSAGYAFADNWQVRLKLTNLLNEKIVSAAGYNSPGQQWFMTFSYRAL